MLGKIRGLRAMMVAATAVTLAGAGSAAYAASNSTSVIVKGPDHQRLTFVVSPPTTPSGLTSIKSRPTAGCRRPARSSAR
jgi:hypothetical protein